MPEERTVLDHLLEGRDALQREVQRLTAAIDQLDSVLGRIGSTARSDGSGDASAVADAGAPADSVAPPVTPAPQAETPAVPAQVAQPSVIPSEPVNSPPEVEPAAPAPSPAGEPTTVASRPRAARKAPAKKSVRARRGSSTEPPKSIRVHVLEMLQAENRDFGLAEIIDRVHEAGIQAHDDAVRSITIKLMKDGRVERVGRGQYRLARRGSAARASAATASAPRVTEAAPEPVAPAQDPEPTTYPTYSSGDGDDAVAASQGEPDQEPLDQPATDDQPSTGPSTPTSVPNYTPSLNLGQPWND